MTVENFFELFLKELEQHPSLGSYYKFLANKSSFDFRKAYFCQRLQYISEQIKNTDSKIWDIGCGYGTTCIFLAMNGFSTYGSTLEFYYKEIPQRLKYWSQSGDVSLFKAGYENLFDMSQLPENCDYIILQDTLHHLEPLNKALAICYKALKSSGKLIAVEENGNNLIQTLKLYLQRGNKRIIEIYDDTLKKNIVIGNENIRSLKQCDKEFALQGLKIDEANLQYIRIYPPAFFKWKKYDAALQSEQRLWKNNSLLKEYFYFGINFTASKN